MTAQIAATVLALAFLAAVGAGLLLALRSLERGHDGSWRWVAWLHARHAIRKLGRETKRLDRREVQR